MKALITGASSGLGKDFAINLSNMGYDLVLVARSKENLNEVKKLCSTNVEIEAMDISIMDNCYKLHKKHNDIDLLINNAGFGLFGHFSVLDLERELNMVDLNVKSLHLLTRLYLDDMIKKDSGRILNVASIAAFLPGPFLNTYYATKAYVMRYSVALNEELRSKKSNVKISVLCPGPTKTNFNNVANVKFSLKSMECNEVVKYALKKMFKNKLIIIPGFMNRLGVFACRFAPIWLQARVSGYIQKKKGD